MFLRFNKLKNSFLKVKKIKKKKLDQSNDQSVLKQAFLDTKEVKHKNREEIIMLPAFKRNFKLLLLQKILIKNFSFFAAEFFLF